MELVFHEGRIKFELAIKSRSVTRKATVTRDVRSGERNEIANFGRIATFAVDKPARLVGWTPSPFRHGLVRTAIAPDFVFPYPRHFLSRRNFDNFRAFAIFTYYDFVALSFVLWYLSALLASFANGNRNFRLSLTTRSAAERKLRMQKRYSPAKSEIHR